MDGDVTSEPIDDRSAKDGEVLVESSIEMLLPILAETLDLVIEDIEAPEPSFDVLSV